MKTFIIALALIASGCVKVQVTESQVCKLMPLNVPGVLIVGNYSIPVSYHVDLNDLDVLDDFKFLGGDVSGSGLVDTTNVMVDINTVTVYNQDNAAATLIHVPGVSDNLSYVVNDGFGFDVTVLLTGTAPASPSSWVLDTNFCFSGAVDRSYGL